MQTIKPTTKKANLTQLSIFLRSIDDTKIAPCVEHRVKTFALKNKISINKKKQSTMRNHTHTHKFSWFFPLFLWTKKKKGKLYSNRKTKRFIHCKSRPLKAESDRRHRILLTVKILFNSVHFNSNHSTRKCIQWPSNTTWRHFVNKLFMVFFFLYIKKMFVFENKTEQTKKKSNWQQTLTHCVRVRPKNGPKYLFCLTFYKVWFCV